MNEEKSKNVIIVILSLILIGLIAVVLYSFKYQKEEKSKYDSTSTTESTKVGGASYDVTMNEENIKIKLVLEDEVVKVYFNNTLLKQIENGKMEDPDNQVNTFKGTDGKDYLFVNVKADGVDRPFIVNGNGLIIYEFSAFKYYDNYYSFRVDAGHKNFDLEESCVYFYHELSSEQETMYNRQEYAGCTCLTINNDSALFEERDIVHGALL